MATTAKFRIDVAIHDLLRNSTHHTPAPAAAKGLTLPEPIFPQFPERLNDIGPQVPPEKRQWGAKDVYVIRADGCFLTSAREFCRASFTPSRLIYLSSTSAISIAGIAGPTTTKSRA